MSSILMAIQYPAQSIALFCCALFAGASIYVNLVEHPARMQCGTQLAATIFRASQRWPAVMQTPLAAIGSLAAIGAASTGAGIWWMAGGVLLGAAIIFTVAVILPLKKALLDPALDINSDRAHDLLVRWGRLHSVLSVMGLVCLYLFIQNA
jgi:hypothetical protein